ncbi:diacylglycerol/lipid kinase family protein [Nocardia otitidiscaviarum]|uniref:diacylglycerol/lipid kinase family protein n=1 Tax=Nocardia otitidiscaviarum TaxID=1823 RepID=UPI002B4B6C82|nr:YegS/Rv2252/BmrU family lipid kinase [Nocardia otitidiscaviarum]
MKEIHSVALVTNPMSGHGRGLEVGAAAVARFTTHGVRVRELCGDSAADTTRLVRAALADPEHRPDVVVSAGGDGLTCVVLQALPGTGVPLGLVPGGTGNDLARQLEIPDDTDAAVDVVLAGKTRRVDLGTVETATTGGESDPFWFATVTGTGLDARVTLRANDLRWPNGPARYTVAALIELFHGLAVPYRIELGGSPDHPDGTAVIDTDAIMVAVGNTKTYGGGMLICPDAVLDDGLLDLTVVGSMSRLQMLKMLPALSSGKRIDHPAVTQYRAATITLTAPGAPATADGEPAGMLPATFRARPAAQAVLVP